MRVFLAVWLFAVGACVGSFLNVVVLRMPAGIGIARSGSRCPVCLHPIRWFDNIPILSWLILARALSRLPHARFRCAIRWSSCWWPCCSWRSGWSEGLSGGRNLPLPVDAPRYYFRFSAFPVLVAVSHSTW